MKAYQCVFLKFLSCYLRYSILRCLILYFHINQSTAVHLETLNLGHNPITNEGIHILKDGLLKAKGILKLGLSGAKVSCEGK